MEEFDSKIRKEFLSEASEMLEAVEKAFMELEKNPEDNGVIDRIFRLAHTIKGSAMSCGFQQLGEFAHEIETLLVRIREKKVVMSTQVVDTLLAANDRLVIWVEGLSSDEDFEVQTSDVRALIRDLMDEDPSVRSAPKPKDTGLHLFDEEEEVPAPPTKNGNAINSATQDIIHSGLRTYIDVVQLSLVNPDMDLHVTLSQVEETLEKIMKLRAVARA